MDHDGLFDIADQLRADEDRQWAEVNRELEREFLRIYEKCEPFLNEDDRRLLAFGLGLAPRAGKQEVRGEYGPSPF